MSELVLLAAYWNERQWIEASLRQIDAISPKKVIICDGCFDARYLPYSTDGTREIIERYACARENVKVISPVRVGKLRGAMRMWLGYSLMQTRYAWHWARFRAACRCVLMNQYRVNQALTFNYMLTCASPGRSGDWLMTYDADQFFFDDTLRRFSQLGYNEKADLLTGRERTFFGGFDRSTTEYEKRQYNNMPHRIFPDTYIVPTRGIIRSGVRAQAGRGTNSKLYINWASEEHVGEYCHYKIREARRAELTYSVGDRKPPSEERTLTTKYSGEHPRIIKDYFGSEGK